MSSSLPTASKAAALRVETGKWAASVFMTDGNFQALEGCQASLGNKGWHLEMKSWLHETEPLQLPSSVSQARMGP